MLERTPEPWPPRDVGEVLIERQERLAKLRHKARTYPEIWLGAREYYRTRPVEFAAHWAMIYEPRNAGTDLPTLLPFTPFVRQRELFAFIYACLDGGQNGLVEKCRDMGATWVCAIISVHLWLFWPGASIGWGSQDADLVDELGNPKSVLEKIRIVLRHLPRELLPRGFGLKDHMMHMRIVNPETGATITGDAGDNIGRGGRTLITFKDESAHYVHAELIEAALATTARTQIDISSVHGLGNVFHRKREAGIEWVPGEPVTSGRTNVLVLDWRHHPAKSEAWHEEMRLNYEAQGLSHIFAQEIDRDYSAAVEGVVIPAEWVRSCIDAHVVLGLKGDGRWCAALDIADEGGDTNALAKRKGIILRYLEEWGARDPGVTARKAIDACRDICPVAMQYDAVGMGTNVKSEWNRLGDEGLRPRGLRLVPWNAGATPLYPERRVIPDDRESPKNEDFYANLKAQAWWELRRRVYATHCAVQAKAKGDDSFTFDEDDLISLPSDLPLVWKLVKELSQPTKDHNSRMKLLIDKKPDGTKSPNLADAVVMCFWPVPAGGFDIPDAVLERAKEPHTADAVRRHKDYPLPPRDAPAPPPGQRDVPLRLTRPPPAAAERIG